MVKLENVGLVVDVCDGYDRWSCGRIHRHEYDSADEWCVSHRADTRELGLFQLQRKELEMLTMMLEWGQWERSQRGALELFWTLLFVVRSAVQPRCLWVWEL